MSTIEFGYIYVASNPCFKENIYKIGYTDDVAARMRSLSNNTAIPEDFKEEFSIFVPNPRRFEEQLHFKLDEYRRNSKREFFKCKLQDIIDKIYEMNEILEDAWGYLLFYMNDFWNIASQSLSDEFITKYILSAFEKGEPVDEDIEDVDDIYIKNGKLYYAQIRVCLGTIEEVQEKVNQLKE